jgi:hypothetical protein
MPRTSMPRDPVPRGSRPLPDRPNLRYLKLEAKRRLAAGEFPALHDAQIAIAWEHGLPSWTALKQHICAQSAQDCQVLPQLSWLITRFRHADQHGWTAPAEQELQQHFAPEFLAAVPAPQLIATISGVAPVLRRELAVVTQARLTAQVQLGGLDVFASVTADPPHKLTGLMAVPTGRQITDPRMSAPAPWPGSPAASRRAWPRSRTRPPPSWACPAWPWPAAVPAYRRGWSPRAGPT